MSERSSWRVLSFFRKIPRTALLTTGTTGFSRSRIERQRCSASRMTMASWGFMVAIRQSAIWVSSVRSRGCRRCLRGRRTGEGGARRTSNENGIDREARKISLPKGGMSHPRGKRDCLRLTPGFSSIPKRARNPVCSSMDPSGTGIRGGNPNDSPVPGVSENTGFVQCFLF